MRSDRSRTRFGVGAAIVLALTILSGAPAAQASPDGTLVAPYESATSEHACTTAGDCSSGASVSGDMSVHARANAVSDGGTASASASASSTLVAAQELTGSVPSVKYILHFDLSEGGATMGGSWNYDAGDWGDGYAQYSLSVSADHSACESCSVSRNLWQVSKYWWDDVGNYSGYAPRETWYPLTISNPSGGAVPAGTVRITIRLSAYATASVYREGGTRTTYQECVYPPEYQCPVVDFSSSNEAHARAVGRLTGIDHEILGVKPLTQAPTARFTYSCTSNDYWGSSGPQWCWFDGRGSSDPDDEIVEYNWDFGDGWRSVDPPNPRATHRYELGNGSYTATLTVVDRSGASDSESITFTPFKPNELPVAAFTASCNKGDCVFDMSGSYDPDGQITWVTFDFGDGYGNSGGPGPRQHTYQDPSKTYVVKLTVQDDRYGTNTVSKNVTPQQPNQLPTARFTVSCAGATCTFAGGGSSDPDGQINRYSWTYGDGTSFVGGPSVQHRYAEGTASYLVTLTVTDDRGGTDSESLTVRCTKKNQNKPTTCR